MTRDATVAPAEVAGPDPQERFEFGRNWKHFIQRNLRPEKIAASRQHLLGFMQATDLTGRTFLDIGCGSGLHSLAAYQSGASQILSFDYDAQSVEATEFCRRFAGEPANWRVVRGSILDDAFVATLPRADVVYSWGVLHHTGDVWRAIRNAAGRVSNDGVFYIALYSADVQLDPRPEFWLDVKRRYISSSWWGRQRMVLWYIWRFGMRRRITRLPVVVAQIIERRRRRGMSYFTDIRDWLGGWPMEFVKDADAIAFCQGLGLHLERIKTGEANTEFLFRRTAAEVSGPR